MFDGFDDDDVTADYQQMLRVGTVGRELTPPEHPRWRAAMRAKARSDRLRIRTRSHVPPGLVPYAMASLVDREYTLEDLLNTIRRLGFLTPWGEPDIDAYTAWFNGEGPSPDGD